MRYHLALIALLPIAAALHAASPAKMAGTEWLPQAKISLSAAKALALKARPGVVADQELEKEKGGSGLRFSFDIKAHGKTYEVGVDAANGKILENKAEGPNPD